VKYSKSEYEFAAFAQFHRLVGLRVDEHSIVQNQPPYPDITCRVDGQVCNFELTRLTDRFIEEKVLSRRKALAENTYSNFRIDVSTVHDVLIHKTSRRYCYEGSLDLIIHEGAAPLDRLWDNEDALLGQLKSDSDGSCFSSIWLIDFSEQKYLRVTSCPATPSAATSEKCRTTRR
jgi:hypothetical protein